MTARRLILAAALAAATYAATVAVTVAALIALHPEEEPWTG